MFKFKFAGPMDSVASSIHESSILDHLIFPILEVTRDRLIELKFDRPIQQMCAHLSAGLDLDEISEVWEKLRKDCLEPDKSTISGLLVHRACSIVGCVQEFSEIPWKSIWAVVLIVEAFKSLREDSSLEEYLADEPAIMPETPKALLTWRMQADHHQSLECEIDGTVIDLDARDPGDQNATNDLFWIILQFSEGYGFTVRLDRRVWVDREETQFERRTIAQTIVREFDMMGQENRRDPAIQPVENGRRMTDIEYYKILVSLWLYAFELATGYEELVRGMRKAPFINYGFLNCPQQSERLAIEGPGPYTWRVEMEWGPEAPKFYEAKFRDRVPEMTLKGKIGFGSRVRFGGEL